MNRSQLAHILRAASRIVEDRRILVIGSQAILGSFPDEVLPLSCDAFHRSRYRVLDDESEHKADAVDGSIGEVSDFHQTNGVYGQGVGIDTATLPQGWEERLVRFDDPEADPSEAYCLDSHDLVVSKLVAGREKDISFAKALAESGLIHVDLLEERTKMLNVLPTIQARVLGLVQALGKVSPAPGDEPG